VRNEFNLKKILKILWFYFMRSDCADLEGFGFYPKRYYVLDRLHISTEDKRFRQSVIRKLCYYNIFCASGIIYKKLNAKNGYLIKTFFIYSIKLSILLLFFFLSFVSNFNVINLFSRGFTHCPFYLA